MPERTMPADGRDLVPRRWSWAHSCDKVYCHQATGKNTAGFVHTIRALEAVSPPRNIKRKAVQLQKDLVAAALAQCCLHTPLLLGPRRFISPCYAAQPPPRPTPAPPGRVTAPSPSQKNAAGRSRGEEETRRL